ncbi:MAG: metal ABC transporter permease [Rhodothermales bacterium]
MSQPQLEIQLIAIVVAAACALPGVFLVLRKMAMMSDAISHAILPGIVVAFFLTGDLNAPLLIIAAALTGVLTVVLVEVIYRTKLVKEDAAIGLVFPALFSIGVILIAQFAGDVHLDTDAVLLGELAFAPFDRIIMGGLDLGPRALWVMSVILILNALFITLFYKELKLATFDAGLAAALGFLPGALHYGLMGLVSVTAVGAFDAVGSILVVALMVGPAATANLLTDKLPRLIGLSLLISIGDAIAGYWMAHLFDTSIAGSMASIVGLSFVAALMFAPHQGVVAVLRRRRLQRLTFAAKMLTIHLANHEGTPDEARENQVDHLEDHLTWDAVFATRIVKFSVQKGLVKLTGKQLSLTDTGRSLASEAVVN